MSHPYKARRIDYTAVDFTITSMSDVSAEQVRAIGPLTIMIPNDTTVSFVSPRPIPMEDRLEEYLFVQVRDFLSGILSARGVIDPNTKHIHKVSRNEVVGFIGDYLACMSVEFSIQQSQILTSVDEIAEYLAKNQAATECIGPVTNAILESPNNLYAFLIKQLRLTSVRKNPLTGNNSQGEKDIEILSMSVHVPLLNKTFSLDMATGGYGRFSKNQINCTDAANGLFVDFAHACVSDSLKRAADPAVALEIKLECLRDIKLIEEFVEFLKNGGVTASEINCVNLPRLPREVSAEDHRKFYNLLDRTILRRNTRVFEDLLDAWLSYAATRQ